MKILETGRLVMRPWSEGDAPQHYEYAQNPRVGPSAGWKPHESVEESLEIINSFIAADETWAVTLKDSGKIIGALGLHRDKKRGPENIRELGYVLSEPYWGKGLMVEAAKRALRFGFEELELEMISVYHFPFNCQSKRVIEKLGFSFEGILRRAFLRYDGAIFDDYAYSMTAAEFFEIWGNT